jgi:hypothetical protein
MCSLVGRELIAWTQQLEQPRSRTIVLTAILERVTDDYGVSSWRVQLEGQRAAVSYPPFLSPRSSARRTIRGDAPRKTAPESSDHSSNLIWEDC